MIFIALNTKCTSHYSVIYLILIKSESDWQRKLCHNIENLPMLECNTILYIRQILDKTWLLHG